jgi:glycine cleavage system H protein
MSYPADYKYTKEHEWIRTEGAAAAVGITDFAQSQLGEVVYVELPEVGRVVEQGDTLAVVESTKAASDVYAPVSGKVTEVNSALTDNPGLVNSSPHDDGWLVTLTETAADELDALMDSQAYEKFVEEH